MARQHPRQTQAKDKIAPKGDFPYLELFNTSFDSICHSFFKTFSNRRKAR